MKQRLISLFLALFCIAAGAHADVVINEQNFPDGKFREYLSAQDYGKDGKITDTEIASVTYIMIDDIGVEKLTGIKYFTALEMLFCSGNQLKTLDLSKNTALQTLYCNNNQLTTLKLPTALVSLECNNNQLTTLTLPTALIYLSCSNNSLGSLDVSNCLALVDLSCSGNQLKALDVSKNTALTSLNFTFNQLSSISLTKNTALISLSCGRNQLTTLDVSKNTALNYLDCIGNQLTTLDVSKNTLLYVLNCYNNAIRGEGMTALVNSLPTIPAGVEEGHFVVYNESGGIYEHNRITTAQVKVATDKGWKVYNSDKVEYAGESSGEDGDIAIDAKNFPDENFRNWLLAQDYGADGKLTSAEIAGVDEINVYNKNIADLTGIAYFTNLKTLDCTGNELTSLDVTKNTALEALYCNFNELTTLDVSKNTALQQLHCYKNQLTTLDVTNNTALIILNCYNNQLTSLDVSNNTALYYLDCSYNQLTTLNVSNNTALQNLYCYNNKLTTLDLSKNTLLYYLSCCDNAIRGEGMTALVNSLPTIPAGDEEGHFLVYDESGGIYEHNRITTAQVKVATDKGWRVLSLFEDNYAGEPEANGDANGDGLENIADVVMLSKAILKGSTDLKYDVNGDGQVNAKDITELVNAIAGY